MVFVSSVSLDWQASVPLRVSLCGVCMDHSAKDSKKTAPVNAWSKPLQSKSVGPPPGLSQPSTSSSAPPSSSAATPTSVDSAHLTALRERYLQTLLLAVGQSVVVSLKDGLVLEGVLHTASPFASLPENQRNKYVLKAVVAKKGTYSDTTAILDMDKVTSLKIKSLRLQDHANAFTDTEISRGTTSGNRELQSAGAAWTSPQPTPVAAVTNSRAEALANGNGGSSAAVTAGLKGSIGTWDQFQANEKLFNVKSSFDENIYTTELDKSKLDTHQIKKAEKLAKEIESAATTNIHLAEERNQALQTDFDEEDRYSGVIRKTKTPSSKSPSPVPSKEASTPPAAAAPKATEPKPAVPATTKMNYAAAAAKTAPPGFAKQKEQAKTTDKDETKAKEVVTESAPSEKPEEPKEVTPEKKPEETAPKEEEPKKEEAPKSEETAAPTEPKDETMEAKEKAKEEEEKQEKRASKLNANAKEFKLNINASTFTPGGFGGDSQQHMPQMPMHAYPQHMHMGDPNMMPPHMYGPMGQPGMFRLAAWLFFNDDSVLTFSFPMQAWWA